MKTLLSLSLLFFTTIIKRSGKTFGEFLDFYRRFAPVDPKSVKRYWQLDWILTLLGATGVKAVRKYVGEIEPWPSVSVFPTLTILRENVECEKVELDNYQMG